MEQPLKPECAEVTSSSVPGGKKIRTEKDLNEVVSKAKGSLAVLVDRNGSREFIPVKLSDEVKK